MKADAAPRSRDAVLGTGLFLASDAMGFAALLTTAASLRAGGPWHVETGLGIGAALTACLVGVSGALLAAGRLRARGRRGAERGLLGVALACAVAFLLLEYRELTELYAGGFRGSLAAHIFYVIIGYHAAHVAGGALALAAQLPRRRSTSGVAGLSLYWHFVDVMWLFLFGFFYL